MHDSDGEFRKQNLNDSIFEQKKARSKCLGYANFSLVASIPMWDRNAGLSHTSASMMSSHDKNAVLQLAHYYNKKCCCVTDRRTL